MNHLRAVRSLGEESRAGNLPPFDLDAEGAVLSAALMNPKAIGMVIEFLRPEHFYSEAHRRIFEACIAVKDKGAPVDIVNVGTELRDRERIEQVGGMAYLTTVLNSPGETPNVAAYGKTVHDKWRARQVIAVAHAVAAEGYGDYGDVQSYTERSTRALAQLATQGVGSALRSNTEDLLRIAKELATPPALSDDGVKITGFSTGIPMLDKKTLGLHASDKTTVVALPGRGKTAFGLQLAMTVAAQGVGVLYFSLEMERKKLLYRAISNDALVDGSRLRARTLSQAEWDRITASGNRIGKLPLWIDDTADLNIEQVRQSTIAHVERSMQIDGVPLGLVVLDYVQRLRGAPGIAERHMQIADATKRFKQLCQELKIAGIELAQQKPSEVDRRTGVRPKPTTGSVAGSSEIEKEADNLYYLHRNAIKDPNTGKYGGEDPESVALIMDKQREGTTGEFNMRFDRPNSRFFCVDDPREDFE